MTDRPLQIDIRDRRLSGSKRLRMSAATRNKRVRAQYVSDIRTLLDGGFLEEVERVRSGEITLAEVRQAVRLGDFTLLKPKLGGKLTLDEALTRVLDKVAAQGVEGTTKEYRVVANQLRVHFGPTRELAQITSEEAVSWLQSTKQTTGAPWSPGRQSVVRALIGRVWADEIRRDLELARKRKAVPRVTDNPWRALKLPRVRPTRFTFLSGEQWRAIVEVSRGTPGMAYLALCCLAGLRMKEAGHLRTHDDIDLEAGVVRIQSRDGEWPWRPKTERGERVVPMGAELRAFLTEHIERGYAGQRYLLVLPYRDQPLSAPTLAKWCKAGFEAAGVPYGRDAASLTSHSLRHTFASWLVQRDVSPLKVAELLGDTAEITMRTYSHLSPRDLTKAIAIIDDVARGG